MNIKSPLKKDIPQLRELWKEAFADSDKFLDSFFASAFSTGRSMCAFEGDRIIAALYWFDCECEGTKQAYLYAIATAQEYRGKGICHKLMEFTHTHLIKLAYDGAILVPGSESLFRFYESIGYQTTSRISEIKATTNGQKIELTRIDKSEYAKIRREMLPFCGVVQERENLDFLLTQAQLYKGGDFLLAARIFGDTLYGIELLGKTDTAESIVCSLGCKDGRLRIPGDGTQFAMHYPLKDSIKPSYFGLAFD